MNRGKNGLTQQEKDDLIKGIFKNFKFFLRPKFKKPLYINIALLILNTSLLVMNWPIVWLMSISTIGMAFSILGMGTYWSTDPLFIPKTIVQESKAAINNIYLWFKY